VACLGPGVLSAVPSLHHVGLHQRCDVLRREVSWVLRRRVVPTLLRVTRLRVTLLRVPRLGLLLRIWLSRLRGIALLLG
jgi:hypothetical protein